jgi:hypothetical protein
MAVGSKRTLAARLLAAGGCLCGLNGFWQEAIHSVDGPVRLEWFTSGTLLLLLAVFLLLDGAVAFEKSHEAPSSKP